MIQSCQSVSVCMCMNMCACVCVCVCVCMNVCVCTCMCVCMWGGAHVCVHVHTCVCVCVCVCACMSVCECITQILFAEVFLLQLYFWWECWYIVILQCYGFRLPHRSAVLLGRITCGVCMHAQGFTFKARCLRKCIITTYISE